MTTNTHALHTIASNLLVINKKLDALLDKQAKISAKRIAAKAPNAKHDKILAVFSRSRRELTIYELIKRTKLPRKYLVNALSKLKAQDKIKRVALGVYRGV